MHTISQGKLNGATFLASPNCNARPQGQTPSLLVVHNISLPRAVFGNQCVPDLFLNRLDCTTHASFTSLQGVEVSAHLFIRRTGQVLQFVNFDQRAWHAGVSCFEGQEGCNDFSIGIELEGCDDIAYTAQQYTTLLDVSRAIMAAYPAITIDRIVGHNTIAPQRKTDPGAAFDWVWFKQQIIMNSVE